MRIHSKIGRDFLLNSFFLLAVIAGLLNTNLFRQDVVITYHNGYRVDYPTELVLDSVPRVLTSVFFYDDIPNSNEFQKLAVVHFYTSGCLNVSAVPAKARTDVNYRSYTSFCYFSLFNIPHQNSDEGEALGFPLTAV
jgi:hypothetical protein